METKEKTFASQNLEEIGKNNVYVENGFDDRNAYMEYLADMNGIPVSDVWDIAWILGPDEDFDALVTTIDDYAISYIQPDEDDDEDDEDDYS